MAKANPKAWFTHPIARITYSAVDKHAHIRAKYFPYFPTWQEAHAWMLAAADKRLKRAQAELKSATSYYVKIKAMTAPVSDPGTNESAKEE